MDNLTALRARDDLLAVAAAWGALKARLEPAGSAGTADRVAGTSEPRLPMQLPVSDLLHRIEQHARFLGKVLLDEVPPQHGCDGACHGTAEHRCAGHHCATDGEPIVHADDCPTRRDAVTTSRMPDLLIQVAHRYGHFTSDPDEKTATDFTDEAHELRRKAKGVIEHHQPARWQGPCPETDCDGQLYQRTGSIDATCRMCGRDVGPAEWRAIMEEAFDSRLMTLSELVTALYVTGHRVPEETVRTWAKRGAKHGDPARGLVLAVTEPDLYRFADAHALAERRNGRMSA